jgi:hypothetical protein
MKTKTCSKCKKEYSATKEYFYRHRRQKDGLNTICKKCDNKAIKKYCKLNRERTCKRRKKYYEDHKRQIRITIKKYLIKNKKEIKRKRAKYYLKNKDRINVWRKKYNLEHREEILKRLRRYYIAHKSQRKSYIEKNRKRINRLRRKYCSLNKIKIKKVRKIYCQKNKEKIAQRHREYVYKNSEKIKKRLAKYCATHKKQLQASRREYLKKHRKEIYKRIYEYEKRRSKTDLGFKILRRLRSGLHSSLRSQGAKKSDRTLVLTGCTIKELIKHIESRFDKKMTWNNYGFYGWHIDHKKPCAAFDLIKPEEQRKCFNWKNLQPMWWYDNLHKNSFFNGKYIRKRRVLCQSR